MCLKLTLLQGDYEIEAMLVIENFAWAIYLLTFITIVAIIIVLGVLFQRVFLDTRARNPQPVPHGDRY
uniref:Uncharacterized protein n=1 Tax=Pineapple mealybug wilt-associated virus 5 TaxID=451381 RepID=B2BD42_9CLOS|nr:unknown protein [Pineapple mealybug wilt-associated virus 5]